MSDPPFLKNNHPILTTPPFFMGKILTSPFGKSFGSRGGGLGGVGGGWGGLGGWEGVLTMLILFALKLQIS